jgi:hypothetical protein
LITAVQQFRASTSAIVTEREAVAFTVIDQSHLVTPGWTDVDLLRVPGKPTAATASVAIHRTLNGLSYTGSWQHQASPLTVRGGVLITGTGTRLELTARVTNGTGTISMKGTVTVKGTAYTLELDKVAARAKNGLPQVTTRIVVMKDTLRVYDKSITRSMNPTAHAGSHFLISGTISAHAEKDLSNVVTGTFTGVTRETQSGKVTYTAGKLTLVGTDQLAATLVPQTDGTLAGPLTQNGAQIGTVTVSGYAVKITLDR